MTLKKIALGSVIFIILCAIGLMLIVSKNKYKFYQNLTMESEQKLNAYKNIRLTEITEDRLKEISFQELLKSEECLKILVLSNDRIERDIKYYFRSKLFALDNLASDKRVVRRDFFDTEGRLRVCHFYSEEVFVHKCFFDNNGNIVLSRSNPDTIPLILTGGGY